MVQWPRDGLRFSSSLSQMAFHGSSRSRRDCGNRAPRQSFADRICSRVKPDDVDRSASERIAPSMVALLRCAPRKSVRASRRSDGKVVYRLRRPWPNASGATHLVLEPLDFLRRLAALVSFPYAHQVRYHGVFANRSRLRKLLPPPPPSRYAGEISPDVTADVTAVAGEPPPAATAAGMTEPSVKPPRPRSSWAQLLRRVLSVDALSCPRCSSREKSVPMVVLAFLSDPDVVSKILRHRVPRMHAQPAERQKGVQSCLEDEGRSLGVGLQGRIPNHLKLRWSRARVVSVEEEACRNTSGEDQKDERKRTVDDVSKRSSKTSKPGGVSIPGQAQRMPADCLSGVRHEGGVSLVQAFRWNVGTRRPDVKERAQTGGPRKGASTDAGHGDGVTHSSGEGPERDWSEGVTSSGRGGASTNHGRSG